MLVLRRIAACLLGAALAVSTAASAAALGCSGIADTAATVQHTGHGGSTSHHHGQDSSAPCRHQGNASCALMVSCAIAPMVQSASVQPWAPGVSHAVATPITERPARLGSAPDTPPPRA